eukprot:191443-Chlamydomonas_euryale.AAC.6
MSGRLRVRSSAASGQTIQAVSDAPAAVAAAADGVDHAPPHPCTLRSATPGAEQLAHSCHPPASHA